MECLISQVVSMLQDADSGSASQKDLVQRVRDMVAEGQDPESAQQMIVEEHAGNREWMANNMYEYL